MTDRFELHPQLAADCVTLGDLPLCRVLLMNDSRFPWCILVPRRAGLGELHELDATAGARLFEEINRVSHSLRTTGICHKINVGALGNRVPQLHIHVVARHPDDAAWPGPVWGSGPSEPYSRTAADALAARLRAALGLSAQV
jgi:diadenosine tetraphosphate (Ap4A) HIT family hydrolase